MIKYSLCIEPVLEDINFYDRIRVAAELGFDALEFWDPIGKDIAKIGKLAAENKIKVAICCVKDAWNLRMNFPSAVVVKNVTESAKIAKDTGCNSLIGLSGDVEGKADSQKSVLLKTLGFRCFN